MKRTAYRLTHTVANPDVDRRHKYDARFLAEWTPSLIFLRCEWEVPGMGTEVEWRIYSTPNRYDCISDRKVTSRNLPLVLVSDFTAMYLESAPHCAYAFLKYLHSIGRLTDFRALVEEFNARNDE